MIRPRGGSFTYTSFEMLQMEHSIKAFNHAGADGYVFGCLWGQSVNETDCERLIKAADGKPCTFHKAFDLINPEIVWAQLQTIIELGFKYVLTSGQRPTALEGKDMLHKLVYRCQERKEEKPPLPSLDIIAGGGIRRGNLEEIVDTGQGFWYHSSAVVDEGEMVSQKEVKKMRKLLDSYSVEGEGELSDPEEDSDDDEE
jgi:copper homeostasis protein